MFEYRDVVEVTMAALSIQAAVSANGCGGNRIVVANVETMRALFTCDVNLTGKLSSFCFWFDVFQSLINHHKLGRRDCCSLGAKSVEKANKPEISNPHLQMFLVNGLESVQSRRLVSKHCSQKGNCDDDGVPHRTSKNLSVRLRLRKPTRIAPN